MKTVEIEISYYTDSNLKPCVAVPLTNSDKKVHLYQEDFDNLIRSGLDPRWRIIDSGQIIERGRNRISVTRLVANAKKGDNVKLLDGDRCNLKRSNIILYAGNGKSEGQEDLSPENKPHRFHRVVIKPKYLSPPWMLNQQ